MEQIRALIQRIRSAWRSLPPRRRSSLVVSIALAFAATAAVWGWAAYDPMVLLFEQPLDAKTAASVLDWLEQAQIPHRIEPGSERILVARSERDRVALELRGSSMIGGAVGGQELLDNAPIGSTQFMERRRWTMALQREIETQINGFAQVLGCKVLLSMPEEALFEEEQVDPSASVYVELRTGQTLSADEGERIAALVAAAVPKLRPDRVEILDDELRVIHSMRESDAEFAVSGEMASLRRQYDRYYTGKIERILERIVGPGNVVAQVNVELDHTERTIRQRELDGKGAVVIAQRTRESSSTGSADGGVPGTTSNTPELGQPASRGGRENSEADEVANVDVPDKQTHIASLPGGIVGITASVVVDGTWTSPVAADGGETASPEPAWTPRSPEELAEYARIVAGAIGTTPEHVTVVNRPFSRLDMNRDAIPSAPPIDWSAWLPWAAVALALLLSFVFVVRPAMGGLVQAHAREAQVGAAVRLDGATAAGGLPAPSAVPERSLADWLNSVATGNTFVTRDEVDRLVRADLVHSVVTLQTWIAGKQG